jgi:hypothetical protein
MARKNPSIFLNRHAYRSAAPIVGQDLSPSPWWLAFRLKRPPLVSSFLNYWFALVVHLESGHDSDHAIASLIRTQTFADARVPVSYNYGTRASPSGSNYFSKILHERSYGRRGNARLGRQRKGEHRHHRPGRPRRNHMSQFPRIANVVGSAISTRRRGKGGHRLSRNGGEKPKDFEDLRDLLGKGSVEAVSIATPNHWHALAAIWAMKAGKDVYGEKPACHNIHEGLEMVKVARETKRIMQVGSQHRSTPFKMKAMEALQGGLIGKIYLAKGLCYKRRNTIGKKPDGPVPPGVNWDIFRGPAPMRPFNENRFNYTWHWFWDTGNGDIGNQGVHEMGIARWALGDPSGRRPLSRSAASSRMTTTRRLPTR